MNIKRSVVCGLTGVMIRPIPYMFEILRPFSRNGCTTIQQIFHKGHSMSSVRSWIRYIIGLRIVGPAIFDTGCGVWDWNSALSRLWEWQSK